MKKRLLFLLSILLISTTILTACGGADPTEAPPEPTAVVEPDAPEPTDVPEPVVASPADLAAAYGAFLGDMVAYNTIKMDALAAELLDEPPPFLLDVRTAGELEENGTSPVRFIFH